MVSQVSDIVPARIPRVSDWRASVTRDVHVSAYLG